MKIVVPVKLVPDLVEELEIDANGTALDTTWLRYVLNELDSHAIEQAILLKEETGAEVTVIAPDFEDTEDVLFTAAAAGADQLIKITGLAEQFSSHMLAQACAPIITEIQPDLILTGVQAHDDLDGHLGPILAALLEIPYVGYISAVSTANGKIKLNKEFPGGLIAVMEAGTPLVAGIQSAAHPPRYIAFSRVRQAKNTSSIEEKSLSGIGLSSEVSITRMSKPEVGERAEMLTGSLAEISTRVLEIIREKGII